MLTTSSQSANSYAGPWSATPEGFQWRLIDLDGDLDPRAWDMLDDSERSRAARFHFARDHRRFVAAHAGLRMSLSEVLGLPPAALIIELGREGKPMLPQGAGWTFNLSHSEGTALIALAPSDRAAEIGVDIECVRPVADWKRLAHDHFSAAERAALAALPPSRAQTTFLRCWTRKEACVKAIGTGLTVPTESFMAGIGPEQTTVTIEAQGGQCIATVRTLFEDEHHIAALAWTNRDGPSVALSDRARKPYQSMPY